MNNLVFSATPFRAFSGGIFLILLLFILGLGGVIWTVPNRKEKPFARVGAGCTSAILLLAAIGSTFALVMQWQDGGRTVIVRVEEKKVVESNCSDGGTCTSYLLETVGGAKSYDFTVAKAAFEKVEPESCYRFTYYPSSSLFGKYLQEQDYSNSYEAASTITRIEKSDCP